MLQLFPSFLLIVTQMPGVYAAVSTALLVALSGAALFAGRKRLVSLTGLVLVAAAVGALLVLYAAQSYFGLGTRWTTLVQIVVFLIAAGVVAAKPQDRVLPRLALTLLLLNLLLTISYFTSLREVLWSEHGGTYRFRSYFDEPAEASIMFAICFAIIVSAQWRPRSALVSALLYLTLVAATQSLSGIFLAGALLAIGLLRGDITISKQRLTARRPKIGSLAALGLFVFAAVTTIVWTSVQTDGFLGNRISSFLDSGHDGSAQLRLLSPLQIAYEVYANDRLTIGMGIGGHEQYILDNPGDFPLQVIFTGDDVGEINNGYVALLAMVGFPITLTVLFLAALLIWTRVRASPNGAPQYFLWLMLLMPFVDGRVVSPIYFLVVGLFAAGSAVSRRVNNYGNRIGKAIEQ